MAIHTHIVINPTAGPSEGRDALVRRVASRLDGFVHVTAGPGDAARLARRAAESGASVVVSVGGDGTLHEVVNGLMAAEVQTRPTLAVIPQGTGNDFCRTLEIPDELGAAVEVVRTGQKRPLDVVRVESSEGETKVMVNAATGGFSDKIEDWVSSDLKRRWGALAYLKAALEARHDIPEFALVLELDGERVETAGCALVVANGRYAGGGMPLTPEAQPGDGYLDLMLVQASTTAQRLRALARFVFKAHPDDPAIFVRRAATISVSAEPTMGFNVDGEPGTKSPVTFTVLRHALDVIVPASS